jgi:SAM-dependent methyltransferase
MELQERVAEGWRVSAKGYSDIVMNEFKDGAQKLWTNLILEQAPKAGMLEIVDIGTGPGFFPLILSLAGHRVIGIDASPEMIQMARDNMEALGGYAELYVMDSHSTSFADDRFDMVISRNVVWTLPKPLETFQEWRRILKPGGVLLIFDADWFIGSRDPAIKVQEEQNFSQYKQKYGNPPQSFNDEERDLSYSWCGDMPLFEKARPAWDIEVLRETGFERISSTIVSERLYDEKKLLLNRVKPMFMIVAQKRVYPKGYGMVRMADYSSSRSP